MGSDGDSGLVRNAMAYALGKGSLIVAAAGNYGVDRFPIRPPMRGSSPWVPSTPSAIIWISPIPAGGRVVRAGLRGERGLDRRRAASVSGTSFSGPSWSVHRRAHDRGGVGNLTAAQAYSCILAYANDGGAAGRSAVGCGHAGHRARVEWQNPGHLRRRGCLQQIHPAGRREIPTAQSRCWSRTAAPSRWSIRRPDLHRGGVVSIPISPRSPPMPCKRSVCRSPSRSPPI